MYSESWQKWPLFGLPNHLILSKQKLNNPWRISIKMIMKKLFYLKWYKTVSPKIHSFLRHHSVYESSHNSQNKFLYKIHVCWQNICVLPTIKIYGGYLQMLTIILDCSQLILLWLVSINIKSMFMSQVTISRKVCV